MINTYIDKEIFMDLRYNVEKENFSDAVDTIKSFASITHIPADYFAQKFLEEIAEHPENNAFPEETLVGILLEGEKNSEERLFGNFFLNIYRQGFNISQFNWRMEEYFEKRVVGALNPREVPFRVRLTKKQSEKLTYEKGGISFTIMPSRDLFSSYDATYGRW